MEVCDELFERGRVDAFYEELDLGLGSPFRPEISKTLPPILAVSSGTKTLAIFGSPVAAAARAENSFIVGPTSVIVAPGGRCRSAAAQAATNSSSFNGWMSISYS
jgi:hypothetical protein